MTDARTQARVIKIVIDARLSPAFPLAGDGFQTRLFAAGKSNDLLAAGQCIEDAVKAGARPIDILMGLLTPLLYRIGKEWQAGVIGVAEEHRFSSFSEKIYEQIEVEAAKQTIPEAKSKSFEALLMNAYGNSHSLAIRFLALWLKAKGMQAQALYPSPALERLGALIQEHRPRVLLVSMALAEHRPGVVRIAGFVAALPAFRPRVIVGGYAVKLGLVAPIPDAELMTDISSL